MCQCSFSKKQKKKEYKIENLPGRNCERWQKARRAESEMEWDFVLQAWANNCGNVALAGKNISLLVSFGREMID